MSVIKADSLIPMVQENNMNTVIIVNVGIIHYITTDVVAAAPMPAKKGYRDWTVEEVQAWLKRIGIQG